MTTIPPFAAGNYAVDRSTSQILNLKSQLDALSTQLATGRTSDTYAGLGIDRTTSLTARATLSALDGYDAGIAGGQTRISLASLSLSQITTLKTTVQSGITSNLRAGTGAGAASQLGAINFDAALDALNQSAAGQYLFGGRSTETPPVKSSDVILKGDSTTSPKQDGLVTLVSQQKAADLGSGLGRLQLGATTPGNTFTLSEDTTDTTGETRANFGFTLPTAPTTTGTAISVTPDAGHSAVPATVTALNHAPVDGETFRVTVNLANGGQKTFDLTARSPAPAGSTDSFGIYGTGPAAATALNAFAAQQGGAIASLQSANTPTLTATFGGGDYASYAIGLSAQPAVGDSITVQLALRDGTTTNVTLVAQATVTAGSAGVFAIGADAAATINNLKSSLQTALKAAAEGPLSASSTTRASEDFFSASTLPGQQPKRIDTTGPAPTYRDAPANDTVIWYQGDTTSTDARSTASVRVGANRDVAFGAKANETPIQKVLAGFAALVVDGLADPKAGTTEGRFSALASRTYDLLGKASKEPSLEGITADFGLASNALSNAKAQNAASRSALQDTVDSVENAPIQEVAAKLLEVQNRLQASYQITSSLSKLSLVNYMS